MTEATRPNVDIGIREMAIENEILRTTVGSQVHGMAIEGTDDHDEMGIFIEPPEVVLALVGMQRYAQTGRSTPEHYVSRTKPEGVRSEPGDTDLTIYGLRKYMRLACAGNPTVLLPLYAPESDLLVVTDLGLALRSLRSSVVSKHAGWRFLNYGRQQRERMIIANQGGTHRRLPKRPELVERYGYDTKYASHALRLALEGMTLVTTGSLTLPLPEDQREACLAIKTGKVSFEVALGQTEETLMRLERTLNGVGHECVLPDEPDWMRINDWMVSAHSQWWNEMA